MLDDHLIINDPVYGFTAVPRGLLCEIVRHPYFVRLDRIRQLGVAGFVYPGAQHTRKQHSLGALHLMREAFRSLAEKGIFIFDSESEAAEAAILMHDLGHGPYSHVLEDVFVNGIAHEDISLLMMEQINIGLRGELSLAIKIFRDDYPKRFLHELICSQLDMDRLDYLCRDSFYTGVREGNIGAERIIKMLDVKDDRLVVNAKGIYSVENYLMSRRLMYWQVYLHKTAVAGEQVLRAALKRAKVLAQDGAALFCSPSLRFFLYNDVHRERFLADKECLDQYARLDDSDVICALKVWQEHPDPILARLAGDFINRRLFKVEVLNGPLPEGLLEEMQHKIARQLHIPMADAAYFVSEKTVEKEMYSKSSEGIALLYPDGSVRDVAEVSNIVRCDPAEGAEQKHYVFHARLN